MTPTVAIVRIRSPYWRGLRLWVPLFLLWIPLLLLSPLLVLIVLIASLLWGVPMLGVFRFAWALITGLRGVEVDVRTPGNDVLVRIV